MKVLFNVFAAAVLISTVAGTVSAQNPGAARETQASGSAPASTAAKMRGASVPQASRGRDQKRVPDAILAPQSASMTPGLPTTESSRVTSAPTEQGVTRGGPENPSGLKKPD